MGGAPGEPPLHCYALVTYVPHPLRKFLDDLRLELVPACVPHAHVSVLQPRWLDVDAAEAARFVRARAAEFSPFDVEATRIAVFPVSNVVYLELGRGQNELYLLHQSMNDGPLAYQAQFPYHPHITLAQGLTGHQADEACQIAGERWQTWHGPRGYSVDRLTFVQSPSPERWVDLETVSLAAVPSMF